MMYRFSPEMDVTIPTEVPAAPCKMMTKTEKRREQRKRAGLAATPSPMDVAPVECVSLGSLKAKSATISTKYHEKDLYAQLTGQQKEGECDMQTLEQTAQRHLLDRAYAVRCEKRSEIRKAFHVDAPSAPATIEDL